MDKMVSGYSYIYYPLYNAIATQGSCKEGMYDKPELSHRLKTITLKPFQIY